jgi:hypothetical protein
MTGCSSVAEIVPISGTIQPKSKKQQATKLWSAREFAGAIPEAPFGARMSTGTVSARRRIVSDFSRLLRLTRNADFVRPQMPMGGRLAAPILPCGAVMALLSEPDIW